MSASNFYSESSSTFTYCHCLLWNFFFKGAVCHMWLVLWSHTFKPSSVIFGALCVSSDLWSSQLWPEALAAWFGLQEEGGRDGEGYREKGQHLGSTHLPESSGT